MTYLSIWLALIGLLASTASSPPARVQGRSDDQGLDVVAALNTVQDDVKAEGRMFVPANVSRARAVIVITSWGLGSDVYGDPEIRRFAESSHSALLLSRVTRIRTNTFDNRPVVGAAAQTTFLRLLDRLGEESRHPEIAKAPLLFWGHSQAGNVGADFALSHPGRTVGLVLYQSAAGLVLRGDGDVRAVSPIPALIVEGITQPEFAKGSEGLWKRGRSLDAPWAFLLQANAPHGDSKFRKEANALLTLWTAAVLRQRISTDGLTLRAAATDGAWIGDNATGEIAPMAGASNLKSTVSWLPDEPSARAWRSLLQQSK